MRYTGSSQWLIVKCAEATAGIPQINRAGKERREDATYAVYVRYVSWQSRENPKDTLGKY